MSNKKEAIFPDGLIIKKKDTDPDWVIGHLSFKVEEFIKFLTKPTKIVTGKLASFLLDMI